MDEPCASVLLVDDQPADLAALERHLAPCALRLVKAACGEEAIEHVETGDFALVLMDVRMPGLNGFETARRLQHPEPERRVPLIFLTGSAHEESAVRHGYEAGAVDYLRKPVEPDTLRAKVRVFVELYQKRELLRRQQLERHQRERDRLLVELNEAVRLRDEFLSVASHELKTPLTTLALRQQMLRREVEAATPALPRGRRLLEHLEVSHEQTRRLTLLVHSLVDATRVTGGPMALRYEDGVDLAAIVREVALGFEPQAARVRCPLRLDVPGSLTGRWDGARLEQLVAHLLSNALKFGAGAPVHVRLEPSRDDMARLTVRDEGIGMDESVRLRLFGRFERGVSDRNYGGLGLGLFISRQIVQALGGRILVDSAPGQGATFTVELPRMPPGSAEGGAS